MGACACDSSLLNTGVECSPLMKVSQKLIIVPKFGVDGVTENFIDTTDTLDQAYFTALLNAINPEDRWFPLPEHKNATSERGDSVFETFDDATKAFVHEGVRTNKIILTGINASPVLLGKLKAFKCAEFGVFIVDKDRNLNGSSHGQTAQMYPISIDSNTWDVKYIVGTSTTAPQIEITFDWSIDELDEELIMVSGAELAPVNLMRLEGLLDVNPTFSGLSTTTITVALNLEYGTAKTKVPVKGLVIADFKGNTGTASRIYNVTDSLDVTLTSVTETSDGVYALVFPAQTSADKIRVKPVKNGYDFTNVSASLVTIP